MSRPSNAPPRARVGRARRECTIDGCGRDVFRGELCGGHYKRWRLKQPVNVRLGANLVIGGFEPGEESVNPADRVMKTGSEMVDCDSENDELWKYRREAFMRAAANWMLSLGYRLVPDAARPGWWRLVLPEDGQHRVRGM